MPKQNALQHALEQGKLKTRPLPEIEQDQDETILWAERTAKNFPEKIRRGRPPKEAQTVPSRSVTVRFPAVEAQLILTSAKAQGLTISEFVRAAAYRAASPRPAKPRRILP